MSDLYTELLVKQEAGMKEKGMKVGLIVLTVLAALSGVFLSTWGFIVFLAFLVLDYFMFPTFDLEFEYLYVNGELDIDKIMSKQKRKRAATYEMDKMELIAPWDSHEMDYHKQDRNAKIVDYTSRSANAKVYAMIYPSEKGKEIILLEPNDIILKDIQRIAPRKVKLG